MCNISIKTIFSFLLLLNNITNIISLESDKVVLKAEFAPFYHGVASGDPLSDGVIIWTRVTIIDTSHTSNSNLNQNITVSWEISQDKTFETLDASGSTETGLYRDYTVKVDVKNLSPYTFYYYRFKYDGIYSIIGRTKTAPSSVSDAKQLRFATVSCSNIQSGYFNAYHELAERNDFDAVIHLGDYIYEVGGYFHNPTHEILSIADYRTRYAQYRLNPSLQKLHQHYPFITVWDDHEIADNGWMGGAKNHNPAKEGKWSERFARGAKVYDEWLPIRLPNISDPKTIYRKLNYGGLADLFCLDTRFIGRFKPRSYTKIDKMIDKILGRERPRQEMLGAEQREWLLEELSNSTAKWKIIVQQVMMSPLLAFDAVLNRDQWDGYPWERNNLLNHIQSNNIDNVVVLAGDLHSAWAANLPMNTGVEFVTTSVSMPRLDPLAPRFDFYPGLAHSLIQLSNPHIKYMDWKGRGYGLLDLNGERAQNDYFYTGPRNQYNNINDYDRSLMTFNGKNTLIPGQNEARNFSPSAPLAPMLEEKETRTGNRNRVHTPILVTGTYAQLHRWNAVEVQFFLQKPMNDLCIDVVNADDTDSVVYSETMGFFESGVHLHKIKDFDEFIPGTYSLMLHSCSFSKKEYLKTNQVGKSLFTIENN